MFLIIIHTKLFIFSMINKSSRTVGPSFHALAWEKRIKLFFSYYLSLSLSLFWFFPHFTKLCQRHGKVSFLMARVQVVNSTFTVCCLCNYCCAFEDLLFHGTEGSDSELRTKTTTIIMMHVEYMQR